MELPISGLQRLFHTGPSPSSAQGARRQLSLESVTEDAHTYDLLFPELSALRQTQNHAYPLKNGDPSSAALAANSHDDRGGLNIQTVRDVRIIIAQDGNLLGQQPKILYDSSPPPRSPVLRQGDGAEAGQNDDQKSPLQGMGLKRHNTGGQEGQTISEARHVRGLSHGLNTEPQNVSSNSPSSPEAEYRGAFSNPRLRRFGTRPVSGGSESLQSKIARERREETEALLGCMFGSTGFPMVSSTKLHIKPAGSSEVNSNTANSPIATEPVSSRALSRRPTPLTRSITVEDLHSYPTRLPEDDDQTLSKTKNASMLITRLFPVDLTDSRSNPSEAEMEVSAKKPTAESETLQETQKPASLAESEKAKQVKTPTYGIAIVLQLPPDRARSFTPLLPATTAALSSHANQISQSPKEIDQFSWQEPLKPDDLGDSFDRNVEIVLDYWNIINRAISSLELALESKIKDLLMSLDTKFSRQPIRKPIKEVGQFLQDRQKKPKQTSQKILYLPSGALQQSEVVRTEVNLAGKRVALALRTQKVIAGQGRWGIWREEARWIAKWAGSREQNFFFFNLLTAFLGTHTEWLHLLGIRGFRRQHTRQTQRHHNDSALQQRTVIISSDKMAARRLIFLLSAFLPSTHVSSTNEENRPNSPWSNAAYSQSPPSGFSLLRQKSLRRTINRRQRGNRGGPNSRIHERGVSFSDQELPTSPGLNGSINRTALHSRRASDARSIRSLPLTISPTSDSARKGSTTTTATIIPDTAVPVPHFSNVSPELLLGTSAEARPGSSGSFASLSLKHTLHRSESTGRSNPSIDSPSMSRWGSMMSFWSTRRGSSTDGSDGISSSQEGLGISGVSRDRRNSRPMGKLAQMVEEVEALPKGESAKLSSPTSIPLAQDISIQLPDQSTPARNIPERPKIEHFPMKLSIDENDGVIDIDLPMPNSFSSSFASSMSSLKASHTGASSFNDSSFYGRASNQDVSAVGSGLIVDVAGWLKSYHQDFALQAVRPYRGLDEDVRNSMRAEQIQPLVPLSGLPTNSSSARPWTDVCTTLVADAQSFSIHRLILRRRPALQSSAPNMAPTMEEEIISEPIMDLDATLVDAVERVLAQSNQSSRTHSRTHSRTSSQVHSRTASPSHHDRPHRVPDNSPFLEVPRSECKKLVLGALEQVARSVGEELEGRVYGKVAEGRERVVVDNTLREGVRRWLNGAGDGV